MKFTAHNIDLGNGKTTMDGKLIAETQECKGIIRSLNLVFRPSERSVTRVADLGCLEGGYTVEIAREGYQVTGFEARTSSFNNCEFVRQQIGLPNLSFIQEDVKNLEKYGKFDAILCHGLLYHLDSPSSFLEMISGLCNKVLILDTHYSLENDMLYDFLPFLNPYKRMVTKRLPALSRKHNYALSNLTEHEGRKGRWFKEYRKKASKEEIEASKWAAFSNHRAFWPTKKDLLQSLKDYHFSIIYQQFDNLEDLRSDYVERYDRGLFVCHK